MGTTQSHVRSHESKTNTALTSRFSSKTLFFALLPLAIILIAGAVVAFSSGAMLEGCVATVGLVGMGSGVVMVYRSERNDAEQREKNNASKATSRINHAIERIEASSRANQSQLNSETTTLIEALKERRQLHRAPRESASVNDSNPESVVPTSIFRQTNPSNSTLNTQTMISSKAR